MDSPVSSVPDPSRLANRERALGIVATVSVLALLYFARGVLVPITLAIILSLLIAPLVRALRRLHLGQTLSVLAAVVVLALSFAAVAGVIGSQLVRMAQSLPRYERTIKQKLKTLNDVTVGRFNSITGQAEHLVYRRAADEQPAALERSHGQQRSRTQERSGASRESNTPRSSGGAPESGAAQKSGAAQGLGATQGSGATRGPDDTQGSAASKPAASQASENSQEPGTSQESAASEEPSASEDSGTAIDLLIPPESGASQSSASRELRISNGSSVPPGSSVSQRRIGRLSGGADTPIPVELHAPPLNPLQIIEKVLGSIWVPIETAGIVLVVLVFVLLEHDALRDRFIRIAGGNDIRRTTLAINDAGERLSRFFVSQFAVNCGFGIRDLGWAHRHRTAAPLALGGLGGGSALRALRWRVDSGAVLGAAGGRRRSALDLGPDDLGSFHGRRADCGATGRTAAVRSYHGTLAAVGGHCGDILELAVGSDRFDPIDSVDTLPAGCRTAYQGAQLARCSTG